MASLKIFEQTVRQIRFFSFFLRASPSASFPRNSDWQARSDSMIFWISSELTVNFPWHWFASRLQFESRSGFVEGPSLLRTCWALSMRSQEPSFRPSSRITISCVNNRNVSTVSIWCSTKIIDVSKYGSFFFTDNSTRRLKEAGTNLVCFTHRATLPKALRPDRGELHPLCGTTLHLSV